MKPEKDNMLVLGDLRELDPLETISVISAYKVQPENSHKEAMIEFAMRLATSYCRGSRRPTTHELQSFIQRVGEFYRHYSITNVRPLEMVFTNYALFDNRVEGNLEQTIESLWKRFEKYDMFLEKKLGFNVANAIFFASGLLSTITNRMKKTKPSKIKKLNKSEYYDFAFFVKPEDRVIKDWSNAIRFSFEELISIFPKHLRTKAKRYLEFATIPLNTLPELQDPLDENPLFGAPIIKFRNEQHIIPTPYYLLHGLSSRLQKTLCEDPKYRGRYGKSKGEMLEEWTNEELRLIFRSGRLFKRVRYESASSQPDVDIIVNYGEYLIFVECTTKGIPQASRKGISMSIENTLANSIRKCYLQALRAKRAFVEGRLRLTLDPKPTKLVLMIVTDTLYPNLMSEFALARRFEADSYLDHLIQDKEYPYIISIYDLESIRRVADEKTFMAFFLERLNMYEQPYFLAYDEFDYFILFSKPQYDEIKQKIIRAQATLNYVAHLPSPVMKPYTFHVLLDAIGSDRFVVLKIGDKYDKEYAFIAFYLLYELYCTWDVVMKHFVFDAKGFNALMREYKNKGVKCRAVVWEGMYEHLKFCHDIGQDQDCRGIERKLKDGSIGNELNILITFSTDIYEDMRKSVGSKHAGEETASTSSC
jgi:hypothetical protein